MGARRGGVIALPVLALLVLGACGGGEERVLTTEEYAEALVDPRAEWLERSKEHFEEVRAAYARLVVALGGIAQMLEAGDDWIPEEDWGEKDTEAARELSNLVIRDASTMLDYVIALRRHFHDEYSRLRPPQHLAHLHDTFLQQVREAVRIAEESRTALTELDTVIESREEFEEFWDGLTALSAFSIGPEGVMLAPVCLELQVRLAEELGSSVKFCH